MRKINIKIWCMALIAILCVSLLIFAGAERGSWSDSGKYDGAWLGDYDNTSAYTIGNESQLAAFASAAASGKTFENKTITLTANIDMSQNYWQMPFSAEAEFKGTFDGQGYMILGIEIKGDSACGAFISHNAGIIKNVSIKIKSTSALSAGICLYNSGSILNTSVNGELGTSAALSVGGITLENSGKIDNCYSVASLSSADAASGAVIGGIAAKNASTIENCIWKNCDKGTGDGSTISNCAAFTDASTALASLNTQAKAKGYSEWIEDSKSLYDGYPIMKNAAPSENKVNGLLFDVRELELTPEEEYTLSCTFFPENASNKALVWLSTNEYVATVDENGKITAKRAGYATIRATTVDGGKVANCYVHVTPDKVVVKSESIKLDKKEYSVLLGQNVQIVATVSPSNVSNKKVTYKVNDESIVVCDQNGLLTPKAPGTTAVVVTTGDGLCSMAAIVTVLEDNYSQTWDGTVSAHFASGDGTKLNPYVIETPSQLAKLANDVNGGTSYEGCYFVQKISIRLNDTTFEDWNLRLSVINKWTPIGASSTTPFKGNFDGSGFSVNGIYIDSNAKAAGLFGYTSGAVIQNVNVKYSIINAGEFAGSIVGFNGGDVYKCTTNATVTGTDYVGGIAGYSADRIDYCTSEAKVIGKKCVGGIVGCSDSQITNNISRSNVSGDESVGGICGKASAVIENCYSECTVAGDSMCGGVVGQTSMDVVNCYCLTMPNGQNYVGSLAGFSEKVLSSYVPTYLTACGNLPNSDDYLLVPLVDGTFNAKKNNKPYIDTLNLYAGCIYNNTYFEWKIEDTVILPTTYAKALASVTDTNSGVELSGAEIVGGNSYTFEDLVGEKLKAALAKINQSNLFSNSKLEEEDIHFKKNIYFNQPGTSTSNIQSTSYRLTLPIDISKIEGAEELSEYQIFAHVAFINVTSQEMFIYIPEYVSKNSDGVYTGAMRCLSHIINNTDVTNYGETTQRYSFFYSNGSISFSALNTGEWIIAELDDNENIVPIETGSSEVTAPAPIEKDERVFTFNSVLTIIICIVLFFGGAAIILIQRSKNNLRIKGDTKDIFDRE